MPTTGGDPADDEYDGGSAPPETAAPERPRLVVDLEGRTVVIAFLAVLGAIAALSIATSGVVTTLLVLAVLFAFAMDPVILAIQNALHLRRGYAVAVFMAIVVSLFVGVVTVLGPQTIEQARSFQNDLPRVVDDLGSLPLIGDRLVENDVPAKIQEWAATLPRQLGGETTSLTNAAEVATTTALAGIGTLVLLVGLLVDGPSLVRTATMLVPVGRRARARRYGTILGNVIGRYFAGSLVLAGLQGLQVLVTGLLLGVPLSPLLAVWAAVWNLVPQIGGAIGGGLFVLVAFSQGATVGVIAAGVFMAYLGFSNNVLLPVILGRAVDISPLSTMAATVGGFFVAGIIGAMLAVPLLGAAKAMYHEVRRHAVPARAGPGNVQRVARRLRRPGDRAAPSSA
jgi:predicted PurR-regulated permease PerM